MSDKKSGKSSKISAIGNFLAPMGAEKKLNVSGGLLSACVPPVLRDVSKLAAGVASVSASSASATGNPRNKCALEPGHSLMDWIRLGASGKDLTGVGPGAGRLEITLQELKKHDNKNDAWLAIRGRVYNITDYLKFHPGGVDEIMKGSGKDATDLFDNIHPWVNYDQILTKCLIGTLKTTPVIRQVTIPSTSKSPTTPEIKTASKIPRFDWIQKKDNIYLIFYTQPLANPYIEIHPPSDMTLKIIIEYGGHTYTNILELQSEIKFPGSMKINYETGKIDLAFFKLNATLWDHVGTIKQSKSKEIKDTELVTKAYKLSKNVPINYNTHILQYERDDGVRHNIPIGKHVVVSMEANYDICVRSYTTVPDSIFKTFKPGGISTDTVCLLVKMYPSGSASPVICNSVKGDSMDFCKPIGTFKMKSVQTFELFILLAAGTGLTPMLGIIAFVLERRLQSCQKLTLLFFNKTEKDIFLRDQLDKLAQEDNRFHVQYILSESDSSWSGLTGHVNAELIDGVITNYLRDTAFTKNDIYMSACGPTGFVNNAEDILQNTLAISNENMYLFSG